MSQEVLGCVQPAPLGKGKDTDLINLLRCGKIVCRGFCVPQHHTIHLQDMRPQRPLKWPSTEQLCLRLSLNLQNLSTAV